MCSYIGTCYEETYERSQGKCKTHIIDGIVFLVVYSKDFQEIQKQMEYISPRKRKPVVEVWEGMTIEELGKAMGKDAGKIYSFILRPHFVLILLGIFKFVLFTNEPYRSCI